MLQPLSPADAVERCERIMAHAWMVRTFVKHSAEIEDFPELMEIVRTVFDASRALETKIDDPPGYLHMLRKKISKLRKAAEQFAHDAPLASDHTNFKLAVVSMRSCVRELEDVLAAAGTVPSNRDLVRDESAGAEPTERVHFFQPSPEFRERTAAVFEDVRRQILEGSPPVQVEHIGATSVPGAVTKGDLDLLVRTEKQDFAETVDRLTKLYAIHQPENWSEEFASFKDESRADLPVGVQVVAAGLAVDHFVRIRDLLIAQPELLAQLNELKNSFEGKRMEEYRLAKSNFFEQLLK
ncbi:MAG: GrpB family protein [Planctomycetales bacterium]|nr:GrpB family protein [Planctomycetales bacterium]